MELGQKVEQVFQELKTVQLSIRSQEVDILNQLLGHLPRLESQAERIKSFDPHDGLAFEGKDPFKGYRIRRKNQSKRVFCRQLQDAILEQTAFVTVDQDPLFGFSPAYRRQNGLLISFRPLERQHPLVSRDFFE